ncbi:hypothetical protein B0H14DRAFT_3482382 [Mycena olivaceomarginata]|nr:hypothetical protein B0H14DRAFT_3482382 [Mycena olivaceomarginata]
MPPRRDPGSGASQISGSASSHASKASKALGKVKNAAKKDGDEELAFLGSAPTQEKSDTGHGSSGNEHNESDNEEGNTDNDHDNDNTTNAPQSVGTPSVQEAFRRYRKVELSCCVKKCAAVTAVKAQFLRLAGTV